MRLYKHGSSNASPQKGLRGLRGSHGGRQEWEGAGAGRRPDWKLCF